MQLGHSGLRRLDLSALIQSGLNRHGRKRLSIQNLEFFSLIGCKQPSAGTDLGQILFWLEGYIEGCGPFRDVRHLPVILADIGAWAVPIMNLAQREIESSASNRQPASGGFFFPLIRSMAQVEVDWLGRCGLC